MTTARVVETSVTVNNNGPIQDYVHLDDQTQPTLMKCAVPSIIPLSPNYLMPPLHMAALKTIALMSITNSCLPSNGVLVV